MASSSMPSTQSTNLFSLARSKLHFSVGSKDSCSLHRWVLLKNSIIRSSPSLATATAPTTADSDSNIVNPVYSADSGDYDDDDEEEEEEEEDSFMFPDAQKFADVQESHHNSSESEWLDSLLETLGSDDDEDEYTAHDDEDHALSPSISPFSSSDDLSNPHSQSPYYPPPTVPVSYSYPYPVPYPPFHPPLIHPYHVDHHVDDYESSSSLISPLPLSIPLPLPSPTYDDPLPYPYHHLDDVEDLSVPDAIEDTSDDESDAPTTPSLIHSPCSESALSLSLVDPASIPLPGDHRHGRRRQGGPSPQVYIGIGTDDDAYFHPFEFDPLPFHHDDLHHNHTYNTYQEC